MQSRQTLTVGDHRTLVVRPEQARPDRLLVFLPGFMTSPSSYQRFLGAVAGHGVLVVAPRLYRPGPTVLAGRFTADDEAARAVDVVERLPPDLRAPELWLAGHSRGGQAAWLAAAGLSSSTGLRGVVVIDPVDGAGRNPTELHAAAGPAGFTCRTLVVGAGVGERCAPTAVNHVHFARNGPVDTTHVVLASMGHGDLLDDRPAGVARRLCGGGPNPAHQRAQLAEIVGDFLDGRPVTSPTDA